MKIRKKKRIHPDKVMVNRQEVVEIAEETAHVVSPAKKLAAKTSCMQTQTQFHKRLQTTRKDQKRFSLKEQWVIFIDW